MRFKYALGHFHSSSGSISSSQQTNYKYLGTEVGGREGGQTQMMLDEIQIILRLFSVIICVFVPQGSCI